MKPPYIVGLVVLVSVAGLAPVGKTQKLPKATPEGVKAATELLEACQQAGAIFQKGEGKAAQWSADPDKLQAVFGAHKEKLTPAVHDAQVRALANAARNVNSPWFPARVALVEGYGQQQNDPGALGFAAFFTARHEQRRLRPQAAVRAYERAAGRFAEAGKLDWQATTLNNQAILLDRLREYDKALVRLQKALRLRRQLYPKEKHPDGHPQVAQSLSNLGGLFHSMKKYDRARQLKEQALALKKKLYPEEKYPRGHAELAVSLNNLGTLLEDQGDFDGAQAYFEQALRMKRKLFPPERYPQGHASLATGLNNLGLLLRERRRYRPARSYLEQALGQYRTLYPQVTYPSGHPALAMTLHNLGALHGDLGDLAKAISYTEESLAIRRKLYPVERYPRGHPLLAQTLSDLAGLLIDQEEYGRAGRLYNQALAQCRRLFPKERYPQGHSHTATVLNGLGLLRKRQGQYAEARQFYDEALAMRRRLFPKDRFPDGHADLAGSLNNLGYVALAEREYAEAQGWLEEALSMRRKLYANDPHPDLAYSLLGLAEALREGGDFQKAELLCKEALDLQYRLYPETTYPQGHADLALTLNNLGQLHKTQGNYAQALSYYEQCLDMRRLLHPDGHADIAGVLGNLGVLFRARGDYAKAFACHEQALAMWRRLYPEKKHPNGNAELANCLNNMGVLLKTQGESGPARQHYDEALAMFRKLYPPDRHPDGHPATANVLNNIGVLLQDVEQNAEARRFHEEALAIRRRIYSKERLADGHPDLALSLNNLGSLLRELGEHDRSQALLEEALEIYYRLYPAHRHPNGHPDIARTLNNLASLHHSRKDHKKDLEYLHKALAMRRGLYPQDRYPHGHPDLAEALNNLGVVHKEKGEFDQALPYYVQALQMWQGLVELFAGAASEAEALNYLRRLPATRDSYLDVTGQVSQHNAKRHYALLWQGKAALSRVFQRRQQLLHEIRDEKTRRQAEELFDVRRELARRMLTPKGEPQDHATRLKDLSRRKETLERRLARALPRLTRQSTADEAIPLELAKALPNNCVFVDLYHYWTWQKDRSNVRGRYTAFVAARGKSAGAYIQRVDLGESEPIHQAVTRWREEITTGRTGGTASAYLQKHVWTPLARRFPKGTQAVYLCPEGQLATLPWAALPGAQEGRVLLEDYSLAFVPHGSFLLEQMRTRSPSGEGGRLLALGGVAYDATLELAESGANSSLIRSPVTEKPKNRRHQWPLLAATGREQDHVADLARSLEPPMEVQTLQGREATTNRLLDELPQARWAHLATHGFFAAPQSAARGRLLSDRLFTFGAYGERQGVGARNPLVQCGLVLAGANALPAGSLGDAGFLTAEAVVGLDLSDMRLAVLSACETGLGEEARGAGVFSLQQAFHLAGCRNVVASLWKVEDEATAALMAQFYHELWVNRTPPREALRRAQLTIYRHPDRIAPLARERGLELVKVARLSVNATERDAVSKKKSPPKSWAAFFLSGSGR